MTAARTRRLLYLSGFVRAAATSTCGVTVGAYIGKLDAGTDALGWIIAAGLAGPAFMPTNAAATSAHVDDASANATVPALMMTGESMFLPLVIGATMKIAYDVLLWRAFRNVRPPAEQHHADIADDDY